MVYSLESSFVEMPSCFVPHCPGFLPQCSAVPLTLARGTLGEPGIMGVAKEPLRHINEVRTIAIDRSTRYWNVLDLLVVHDWGYPSLELQPYLLRRYDWSRRAF